MNTNSITRDVLTLILKTWIKTEEYAKYCFLNISNYTKSFNSLDIFDELLIEPCVKKVVIEFKNNEIYKADIYVDSLYLVYSDDDVEICCRFENMCDYKIHIVSDSANYALNFNLPLYRYDTKIDLTGSNKTTDININSLNELRLIGKKKFGFENIDLFLTITNKKDIYKGIDLLLYYRYIKPEIIEYHEVYFDIPLEHIGLTELKYFIRHLQKSINVYSQEAINSHILNKRDIKLICKTFRWSFHSSWFMNSIDGNYNKKVININSEILNVLAKVNNQYGNIGIINES